MNSVIESERQPAGQAPDETPTVTTAPGALDRAPVEADATGSADAARAAGEVQDVDLCTRHDRRWRDNQYVYPVISRRSGGLSIGINLNPDRVCNFNCVYCQVDRRAPVRTSHVDVDVLAAELESMLRLAQSTRSLEAFGMQRIPASLRTLKNVAFSGDGEPTASPVFAEVMERVAVLKDRLLPPKTRVVLITNATGLTRPAVQRGLERLDACGGRIWAKLDAGTESFFQQINRAHCSLEHVVTNIIAAARSRPVVIQSMFCRLDGAMASDEELHGYCAQLARIVESGGRISKVQVYTIARTPAEPRATPLADVDVDLLCSLIRARTGLNVRGYHTAGDIPTPAKTRRRKRRAALPDSPAAGPARTRTTSGDHRDESAGRPTMPDRSAEDTASDTTSEEPVEDRRFEYSRKEQT